MRELVVGDVEALERGELAKGGRQRTLQRVDLRVRVRVRDRVRVRARVRVRVRVRVDLQVDRDHVGEAADTRGQRSGEEIVARREGLKPWHLTHGGGERAREAVVVEAELAQVVHPVPGVGRRAVDLG